jgi:1-deoxy-D-xylulose 5-phosphate reductoisomerase
MTPPRQHEDAVSRTQDLILNAKIGSAQLKPSSKRVNSQKSILLQNKSAAMTAQKRKTPNILGLDFEIPEELQSVLNNEIN